MKLLDTMVFVSAMNPSNKLHKTGMAYLNELKTSELTRVPTSSLVEFDLVMRNNDYTEDEISNTWGAVMPLVEGSYVSTTPSAHLVAASLRMKSLTYFDSLIAALAIETNSVVVTRDDAIARHVKTEGRIG